MIVIPEVRAAIIRAAHGQVRGSRRPSAVLQPRIVAGGGAAIAAVIAVAVVLAATPSTTPAYALTSQPDGTYTLTLYSLTNDIPQLNAKLAQMGIDETVIPVTSTCTYKFPIYDAGTANSTKTLYVGRKYLDPGYQGVLAAEALPNGHVALAQGALPPSEIPSCFAPMTNTPMTITPVTPSPGGNTGNTGSTAGNTGSAADLAAG